MAKLPSHRHLTVDECRAKIDIIHMLYCNFPLELYRNIKSMSAFLHTQSAVSKKGRCALQHIVDEGDVQQISGWIQSQER
jgi:hypothetical protein